MSYNEKALTNLYAAALHLQQANTNVQLLRISLVPSQTCLHLQQVSNEIQPLCTAPWRLLPSPTARKFPGAAAWHWFANPRAQIPRSSFSAQLHGEAAKPQSRQ